MPHKVYGQSIADQTRDLQRISSVLWRQTLDNLYLANNPKVEVPDQAVRPDGSTYDDLQDPAPGGIVRTKQPNMISRWPSLSWLTNSFPCLPSWSSSRKPGRALRAPVRALTPTPIRKSYGRGKSVV